VTDTRALEQLAKRLSLWGEQAKDYETGAPWSEICVDCGEAAHALRSAADRIERLTNHIHDLSGEGNGWWCCPCGYRTTTNLDLRLAAAEKVIDRARDVREALDPDDYDELFSPSARLDAYERLDRALKEYEAAS
jgi:hypothetical protein